MAFYESLEAQQEAQKLDDAYEKKWDKYTENPDLAKEEREKANEIFTSKKSPEELKKIQQIINKVEKLKLLQENSELNPDELFEMAEKIIKEESKKVEVPESAEPIVNETTTEVWSILEKSSFENNKWWVQWTKEKIQSNLDLDNNQLNQRLNNKEKNISEATEIFFTKDKISEYSQNPKSENSNTEELKELWESLVKWDKIVDEDLINILWNFIIETWEENLETYSLENPEAVNEALNNAFELQIELVKDWKVNYRTETVENLKKEILNDDLTNPLEKLKKFKELKTEINTSVWSIAWKREKATTWVEKKKQLQEQLKKLKLEYNKIKNNTDNNTDDVSKIKEIKEEAIKIYKLLKEKPKSWEVMWGSDFDKISWVEKISENT